MAKASVRQSTRLCAGLRDPADRVGLLSLPSELVARVASNLDQEDVLALALCSRTLHDTAIRQLFRSPTLKYADGWNSFNRAVAKNRAARWVVHLTWLECDLRILVPRVGPRDKLEFWPSRPDVPVHVFTSCRWLACLSPPRFYGNATSFFAFAAQFFPNVTALQTPVLNRRPATVMPGGLQRLVLHGEIDDLCVEPGHPDWVDPYALSATVFPVIGSTLVMLVLERTEEEFDRGNLNLIIQHCRRLESLTISCDQVGTEGPALPLWRLENLRTLKVDIAESPALLFLPAGTFARLERLDFALNWASQDGELDTLADAIYACASPNLRRVEIAFVDGPVPLTTALPFLERVSAWTSAQGSLLIGKGIDPERERFEYTWPGASLRKSGRTDNDLLPQPSRGRCRAAPRRLLRCDPPHRNLQSSSDANATQCNILFWTRIILHEHVCGHTVSLFLFPSYAHYDAFLPLCLRRPTRRRRLRRCPTGRTRSGRLRSPSTRDRRRRARRWRPRSASGSR